MGTSLPGKWLFACVPGQITLPRSRIGGEVGDELQSPFSPGNRKQRGDGWISSKGAVLNLPRALTISQELYLCYYSCQVL